MSSIMKEHLNIVLCGFMGCGKTTVGQRLAALTGRAFIDTDTYIEKKVGLPINEIFSKYGELHFRELEKICVAEIAPHPNCVIATGGGTILDKSNVLALKNNGKIFFLDAPFEMIFFRISTCTNRPLAQTLSKDELKNLFEARRRVYLNCTDFVVDAKLTYTAICSDILDTISAQTGVARSKHLGAARRRRP